MEEMQRKREKVYISGRMSGLTREEVSRRFTEADRLLRRKGQRTVNPARVWVCRWRWLYRLLESIVGKERAYDLVLIYDLWLLSRCQRIYMVGSDWRESRGAMTEFYFAREKKLSIDISDGRAEIERELIAAMLEDQRKAKEDYFKEQTEKSND